MTDPSISSPTTDDIRLAEELAHAYRRVREEVAKFIVGQDEVVEQALIAMLARGHCLLEGVPGLAKTTLVKTISHALDLSYRRIQFTPDLMPADITGTEIIQEDTETGQRTFVFQPGPLFAQMVLADEINRTPPKSQAALLEAMQEHSVTVGKETYRLEEPFFVMATQNPIEQEGTYPLPEAQRDRFVFQIHVRYPSRDEEREIMRRTTSNYQVSINPVMSAAQIIQAQSFVRRVPVPEQVADFVIDLVRATRPGEGIVPANIASHIEVGAGPRACQNLILASKVRAVLQGRTHVSLDDIRALAHPVLRHRLVPSFAAEAEGVSPDQIISALLENFR